MTTERVRCELDVVTVLELHNPPLNLIDVEMTRRLDAVLDTIAASPEVRAVLVTGGTARAFCAGSDIHEFRDIAGRVAQEKLLLEKYVYRKLARLPMPTIAVLEGDALGGGLELALSCDLRVASRSARFGLPESRLGVLPGSGGTQRLPQLVGPSRAKQMMFLGEIIPAAEAKEIGLINALAEDGGAFTLAHEMADQIAARGPLAVRAIKRLVDFGGHVDDGLAAELDASEEIFRSADMREGAAAFFARRPPQFHGQ